jgi:protein-disulfide isomerase
MGERALGNSAAPVTVHEWYSLTCPHCARFAHDVFPEIKTKLIDTGKLRYVFEDFPLDQVALMAAQVARFLPTDRYWPFVDALLQSQDRWAFAADVNSTDELAKMAGLAGLSRPEFNAAIGDTALRDAILAKQDAASKNPGVDSTPTFIFQGVGGKTTKRAGEMTYDDFAQVVAQMAGTS